MLILVMSLGGLVLGALMPIRWGVFGFLGAAASLFAIQVAVSAGTGFAGSSIEESLLLFNGSWVSYLGFNLQVTYRAFAPVLLALAVPLIWRLGRRQS
ncbi:hypothetical protein AIOL_000073 [Candidatus Rhodobacter oscarellae]|uniref:Uncharacterized protein n=1 Tax=Candidatus Rhodobacter oscarellae TaxID=1675527 RepID=A0A0J9EDW2_9RHOB|nr:hypothetical protein [Candidatus Rhodobacter lobularis]KMW59924.1 hypothetical protein AIOL_000073 [Candidatus Rhodobacter lobularis]